MAGLLGVAGKAKTDQPAVRLTLFLARADSRDIDCLRTQPQKAGIIAVVEQQIRDRHVRHLRRLDEVIEPHVKRIPTHLACDLVDGALDGEACARTPYTAIGPDGCLVSRDREALNSPVPYVVWARNVAGGHSGLQERPVRPQRIGSGIDDQLRIDCKNHSSCIGVGGDLVIVIACVRGREEVLAAVLDPAHRVIELRSQSSDDHLLRQQPRL